MVEVDKAKSERIVRIWDDPLARIHYLETMLADKEWEAVIYQPEFDPHGKYTTDAPAVLQELKEKLEAREYSTILGTDENGIPVLRVKNFGAEMNVSKALEELGMVKGLAYSFTHFNQSFGKTLHQAVDYLKEVARDKARFIGGVYLVGDLLLALAAKFEGKEEDSLPVKDNKFKNALFSAAGIGATLQSLTFLAFAKDQNVDRHNKLEDKLSHLLEKGDLLDEKSWRYRAEEMPNNKGIHGFLKKYPIQLGALFQVLGQVGLIAAAVIGIKQHKPFVDGEKPSVRELFAGLKKGATLDGRDTTQSKAISKISGYGLDVLTGIFSSASWALMTKTKPNQYEKEELASWGNPTRWWQEVMRAPNKLASVLAFAATSTGVAAGWAKGNKVQAAANVTYLAGDAAIYLLESESYGAGQNGKSTDKADGLVQSAKKIMDDLPLILGREEQAQLVTNISHYVAAKVLHEECNCNKTRLPNEDEIHVLAAQVKQGLSEILPPQHQGVEKLAAAIATLAGRFGENEQQMRSALCEKIAGLPAVHVSAEELGEAIARQPEALEKGAIPKDISMVKDELASIFATIPTGSQPAMTDAIYDVVETYTPVSKEERIQLTDYTVDKAFNEIVAAMGKAEGKAPVSKEMPDQEVDKTFSGMVGAMGNAEGKEESSHLQRQQARDAAARSPVPVGRSS